MCPPEVGPAVRLAYKDQPLGDWMIVASEVMRDENNISNLFRIVHNLRGALFLAKSDCPSEKMWPLETRFIFEAKK